MELFILRHGIAEDTSRSGKDRDRELTPEGIRKIQESAATFQRLALRFDRVLTSPYPRANKTAQLVCEVLKLPPPEEFPPLSSGQGTSELLSAIAPVVEKHSSVLLVGHEPDLSRLVSVLVSGTPNLHLTLKKGGFCKLLLTRAAPGHASLEWLLTSRHLCPNL